MAEDPIWPAIKAWREADKRHSRICAGEKAYSPVSAKSCRAYHRAANRMGRTVPTTRAGAAELAKWLVRDLRMGDAPWQQMALRSIVKFLRS